MQDTQGPNTWDAILAPYLPDGILEVAIHDRYVRNRYQLKSLEMFLDMLAGKHQGDDRAVRPGTDVEEQVAVLRYHVHEQMHRLARRETVERERARARKSGNDSTRIRQASVLDRGLLIRA